MFFSDLLEFINKIAEDYGVNFSFEGKFTYEVHGCDFCNKTGYYDRIGVFETLILDNSLKQMIANNESSLQIKRAAEEKGYEPMVIDGVRKVLEGVTTLDELNKKLMIKAN